MNKELNDITIEGVKEKYRGKYIDNDIVLFDNMADVPFPTDSRRFRCIFVALCQQGKAQYSVNTVEHMVVPNDVIIIIPGQVINNYMLSPDLNGIGFMISQDFFSEIVKDVHEISSLFLFSRTNPVSALDEHEVKVLTDYFNLLKTKINDTSHHFRKDVVRMIIATMVYDLGNIIYRIQNSEKRKANRADIIFSDFIKLVEANYRSQRRVGWYGLQLGITAKYLSEAVKQVSQRTPNDWINYYVTMEIRVQLRNTKKTIKEIAQDLNFPNQSFLGKYFKEHVGMSPINYRRS